MDLSLQSQISQTFGNYFTESVFCRFHFAWKLAATQIQFWVSYPKHEMKPRTSNPAGKGVSPIKSFRWKRKKKKKKQLGREGRRTTQQAIHLFTKSHGSWEVEKHHRNFLNKAKNQFLDNQHWEDIFSSNCAPKIQTAYAEIWNIQKDNNSVSWFTGTKNQFLLLKKTKTNRTTPTLSAQ